MFVRGVTALQGWCLLGLGLTFVALAILDEHPAAPVRANPPPTAICALDHDTLTADGMQLWPEGFAAPCKWFHKEQSV